MKHKDITITTTETGVMLFFSGSFLGGEPSVEAAIASIDAGNYDAVVADITKMDRKRAAASANRKGTNTDMLYTDRIGQLVRGGRTVYYAYVDGIVRESYDRSDIVRRLEQEGK